MQVIYAFNVNIVAPLYIFIWGGGGKPIMFSNQNTSHMCSYTGPVSSNEVLSKAVQEGSKSVPYTQVVEWLVQQISDFTGTEERVHAIASKDNNMKKIDKTRDDLFHGINFYSDLLLLDFVKNCTSPIF